MYISIFFAIMKWKIFRCKCKCRRRLTVCSLNQLFNLMNISALLKPLCFRLKGKYDERVIASLLLCSNARHIIIRIKWISSCLLLQFVCIASGCSPPEIKARTDRRLLFPVFFLRLYPVAFGWWWCRVKKIRCDLWQKHKYHKKKVKKEKKNQEGSGKEGRKIFFL